MNSHYTQAEELLNLAATHRSLSLARSSGYERDHALAAQCAAEAQAHATLALADRLDADITVRSGELHTVRSGELHSGDTAFTVAVVQ
jgi:hypothetical protein